MLDCRGRRAQGDLMPDEVGRIRDGGSEAVRAVIGEADAAFAESLGADDIETIVESLGKPASACGSNS